MTRKLSLQLILNSLKLYRHLGRLLLPSNWSEDLSMLSKVVKESSATNPEHKTILTQNRSSICDVMTFTNEKLTGFYSLSLGLDNCRLLYCVLLKGYRGINTTKWKYPHVWTRLLAFVIVKGQEDSKDSN